MKKDAHAIVLLTAAALECACGKRFRVSVTEAVGRTDDQVKDELLDRHADHRRDAA